MINNQNLAEAYEESKDITSKRLYLETMDEILNEINIEILFCRLIY